MSYPIDTMVAIKIGTARQPGRVFGEPELGTVTIPAKPATPDGRFPERAARTIEATWQNVVSLRTSLPDENGETHTYKHISRERTDQVMFTSPRYTPVEGLDYTDGGEKIDLFLLVEEAVADYDAFQAAKAEAADAALTTTGATL